MHTHCLICGRALSNPVTMKIGIGDICRMKRKSKEASEKNSNLFGNRASYDYSITDNNVLAITDRDIGKSVTNDIENVLQDIAKLHDISKLKIMYKDTLGVWDGVRIINTYTMQVEFFPIGETNFLRAEKKLTQKI